MNVLLMLFTLGVLLARHLASCEPGLERAGELIKEPFSPHMKSTDIVLSGLINDIEEAAYRLQIIRMRLGYAWEWVFTDYGFIKHSSGIDLINPRRRIVVELKNSYRINSIVRREDLHRLKVFKARHPRYTVILGIINDRTLEGHDRVKDQVRIMSGRKFLRYIFKGDEGRIIRYLRRAVRSVIT